MNKRVRQIISYYGSTLFIYLKLNLKEKNPQQKSQPILKTFYAVIKSKWKTFHPKGTAKFQHNFYIEFDEFL